MIHIFKTKVYYADTDAYAVAWHGTYLKWLEQARSEFCADNNYDLATLEKSGIVLPVVNVELRYKASAKLHDILIIETKIIKLKKFSITFEQIIKNAKNNKTLVIAKIEVVALDENGKLCRKMPLEGMEKLAED